MLHYNNNVFNINLYNALEYPENQYINENVTKFTRKIIINRSINIHSRPDPSSFLSSSTNTIATNTSSSSFLYLDHYEAWINITNFTAAHQGIYRFFFFELLPLKSEQQPETIAARIKNDDHDDDVDDGKYEDNLIYQYSFMLNFRSSSRFKFCLFF